MSPWCSSVCWSLKTCACNSMPRTSIVTSSYSCIYNRTSRFISDNKVIHKIELWGWRNLSKRCTSIGRFPNTCPSATSSKISFSSSYIQDVAIVRIKSNTRNSNIIPKVIYFLPLRSCTCNVCVVPQSSSNSTSPNFVWWSWIPSHCSYSSRNIIWTSFYPRSTRSTRNSSRRVLLHLFYLLINRK